MRNGSANKALREALTVGHSSQLLRSQPIDEHQPGTILRDFETLLSFVGEEGLATSSEYFFLPISKLNDLNSRMTCPATHALKRPQQKSFPLIHGLFMLLRASGLGVGSQTGNSRRLVIDPGMLDLWRELNATERYFSLMESWLVFGSGEILGERRGFGGGGFQSLSWVKQRFANQRTEFPEKGWSVLHGTMDHLTVALMEAFGWLRVEYRQPAAGEGVRVAAVERLAWGDAMIDALQSYMLARLGREEWGLLQPLFQPLFPQWQKTLRPPEAPIREGVFTFQVSVGKTWRRIAAPADVVLDDLAHAILDAFKFDDDHLYCFKLRGRNGRELRIACPMEDDADSFTDEIALAELPLAEGATMIFHFDYGDDWHFNVKLEKVGPPAAKAGEVRVLAAKGRAPKQYNWDDDDDWEDEEDE
jgi:hypothetical protein